MNVLGPSAEDLWKMRETISKASSLEEIERLNRLLQAGQIPGKKADGRKGSAIMLHLWCFRRGLALAL